ncbi:uroporphyrinogen-III C-methyltransferase [Pasteurellaceae bacterium LIM206]|nr:uroporphyrinogen-III C-methyltransferase [Pasteurellaceae bacterium LIM206]
MTEKQTENLESTDLNKGKETLKADPADKVTATTNQPVVIKKNGGTAIGLLALLIALGVGGAGYYFGQQQVNEIQQKLTALQAWQSTATADANTVDQAAFDRLISANQSNAEKITALQQALDEKQQSMLDLQTQINRLNNNVQAEQPNDWLISEADFLLTNALRKLVVDYDIETTVSLLELADEALKKVSSPNVTSVRTAIGNDIKQLLALNSVDQNAIMQRLSQLANGLDELSVLDVNFGDNSSDGQDDNVSDSVSDWKANLGKSASSFLNHFIRVTAKNSTKKELLAPNQDIYLRENIRLRLQIAILAVPRQQNDLYKQSLETVSSWIRTYFDTSTEVAQNFLKTIDELAEQSIYVDVPEQLSSLIALDKVLNKSPQAVKKIELSADKALNEEIEQAEPTPTESQPQSAPVEPAHETPAQTEPQQ